MSIFDRLRKKPTQSNVATVSSSHKEEPVDPAKLCQLIIYCFDMNELRDLCLELGVDYDALPGEGRTHKAQELVAFLQHPKRSIDDLVQVCSRLRPKAPWTALTEYDPYRGISLADLRRKLVEHFEESELHSLCAKFGVSYKSLPDTGSVARELIAYLARRERLNELAEECSQRRPNVSW